MLNLVVFELAAVGVGLACIWFAVNLGLWATYERTSKFNWRIVFGPTIYHRWVDRDEADTMCAKFRAEIDALEEIWRQDSEYDDFD